MLGRGKDNRMKVGERGSGGWGRGGTLLEFAVMPGVSQPESQHDEILLFALAMVLVYWKGAGSCVVPLMSVCGREDFSMDYVWELRKLWIEAL